VAYWVSQFLYSSESKTRLFVIAKCVELKAGSDELLKLLQIDEKRRMLDEQERMGCAEKERKMKECQKSARLKVKRVLGETSITFETSTCSMQLVD
jgi:hypothetical protein